MTIQKDDTSHTLVSRAILVVTDMLKALVIYRRPSWIVFDAEWKDSLSLWSFPWSSLPETTEEFRAEKFWIRKE
jgi:hypothetical protein